jgi:hypothetical protein
MQAAEHSDLRGIRRKHTSLHSGVSALADV